MKRTEPLPLISFESIMRDPLPPVEWIVESLIPEGDRVVVYGEFGAMKSWVLLHLALHIAAGRSWFDKFPVAQRSVLYVDEEMNPRTMRRRVKRLADGMGLPADDLPFRVSSRAGVRFDADGAETLLKSLDLAGFYPDVVIVETLRRVLIGNETEAKDVSAFWLNVNPLLRAGKTLMVSHHMRKPKSRNDHANRERASGSTDILAGTDSAIAVQRDRKNVSIIEAIKSREAEEAASFVVRLEDDGPESPARLVYAGTPKEHKAEAGKLWQATNLIVGNLTSGTPLSTGELIALLEGAGFSQRTAERAIEVSSKERTICAGPRAATWTVPKVASAPTANP